MQTAMSRTEHTVITNKNKLVHRKLFSNPIPFQQTVAAPTKRINTRQNYDQSSLDMENSGGNPCIYARKATPQPINHERSKDLSKKDQPRNNKGQFT